MPKKLDLTGQRFGRLVALQPGERNKQNQIRWFCECDCGKTTTVRTRELSKGITQSCGCLGVERRREGIKKENKRRRLPNGIGGFNSLFCSYKKQAEKRGHEFLLTKDQFRKLTQQSCICCGIEPQQKQYTDKNKNPYSEYVYNGIDRVDNTKGYTIDNCVSCCGVCNHAKATMTQQKFLNWVEGIHNYSVLRGRKMAG